VKPQLAAYIEADQVKFVYKDFVLDQHRPRAQWAAEATQCAADQGKYWAYHDHLFANQKTWTKDELKQYAQGLGMNTTEFNQCLDKGKHTDTVDAMTKEAKNMKLGGTPTFFINGRQVDFNAFVANPKALIDAELKK
jgi:protein-disulfide isomerase